MIGDQFPYRVNEGSIADCVADKDKREFRINVRKNKDKSEYLRDKTDSKSI